MRKLSFITLCTYIVLSGNAIADIITVNGWDGYDSPPRFIRETAIDDDATGKSTSNGVVILKPTSSNIDKSKDVIDCSSPRFKSLCNQLNLNIANKADDVKTYAEYLTNKDRAEMERQIASTRSYANDRSNQAQNNAKGYSDSKYTQSINYANTRANQAQNSAK
ncbi:hypothetical protein C0W54_12860 [Photobacterium kishitanii]|uniref:hypothetical protein n=1 Tax=Photobacterium kishitanii TaxID=318456 RepID=UPI000D1523FE|nr:hypothetical protein [Photobacterium kishitanii]PSW61161.1 hypothetical protein C0W54_12860 [Photobacterium kishitanii]